MKILLRHSIGAACLSCRQRTLSGMLQREGIACDGISEHEVEVSEPLTKDQQGRLQSQLQECGIQLVVDRKDALIERMKHAIENLVEPYERFRNVSIKDYLSRELYYSYSHLSKLFVEAIGVSPEHYLLQRKTERVKELLITHNLTLTEIAYRLNYSSIAHLSHQFRSITGVSATEWKRGERVRSQSVTPKSVAEKVYRERIVAVALAIFNVFMLHDTLFDSVLA